ncbi:hypothetical protein EVAR_102946_1 [Eumeta japonica]|uniref:Uncharacterized protein n=1 Tax=Eumeta variegata TaxID=151549 RepID=A0A4C1UQX0_EUMVA|nr:hypothetical protein EVAR_102946_1 [Eumeta japonica]
MPHKWSAERAIDRRTSASARLWGRRVTLACGAQHDTRRPSDERLCLSGTEAAPVFTAVHRGRRRRHFFYCSVSSYQLQ